MKYTPLYMDVTILFFKYSWIKAKWKWAHWFYKNDEYFIHYSSRKSMTFPFDCVSDPSISNRLDKKHFIFVFIVGDFLKNCTFFSHTATKKKSFYRFIFSFKLSIQNWEEFKRMLYHITINILFNISLINEMSTIERYTRI